MMERMRKVVIIAIAISVAQAATWTARSPAACAATERRANSSVLPGLAIVTDGSKLIFLDFISLTIEKVPVVGLMPGETLIDVDYFAFLGVEGFIALGSMGTVYVLEESEDGDSFKAVKLGQVPPTFFTSEE